MSDCSALSRFAALVAVVVVAGSTAVGLAVADEPMFVRWLVVDDPGDETIRDYWERAERDELSPEGLVDLGTMLFYRGYPKDARRMYKRALDLDSDLYEAWFRIGLVEHSENRLYNARRAYKRCLKKLTGHGWCNFYLGMLEEQTGNSSAALYHYRRAFKFAPELADPEVNPEVLASDLALGSQLDDLDQRRFKGMLPIPYLEPAEVNRIRRLYEPTPTPEWEEPSQPAAKQAAPQQGEVQRVQPQPTPVQPVRPPRPPAPRRVPQRTPAATTESASDSRAEEVPWGMRPIGNVSGEAQFAP